MSKTRGFRNNNPLNIIKTDSSLKFVGVSKEQTDKKFLQFDSLEYGIRAAVKILITYQTKGCDTVNKIINRWAPPSDNNPTNNYSKYVAGFLGVGVDDKVDVKDLKVVVYLVKAMIDFENGVIRDQDVVNDEYIVRGCKLALKIK